MVILLIRHYDQVKGRTLVKIVNYRVLIVITLSFLFVGCMGTGPEKASLGEQIKLRVEDISQVGKLSGHSISEYNRRVQNVIVDDGQATLQLIAAPGLSSTGTYSLAIDRSALIFETIFLEEKFSAVDEVVLKWHYPVADLKGQVTLNNILSIHLTRKTAETVNWRNFKTSNLASIADYFWKAEI